MTIHHATAKRATKLGIKLTEPDHGYFVAEMDGKQLAEGTKANDVLAQAEAAAFPKADKPVKAVKAKTAKPKKRKAKKSGDDEDEDGEEGTKSVISAKYKTKYKPNKDTCGDQLIQPVFDFLHPDGEDVDVKRLVKLGKDNGTDVMERWGHLKTKHGAFNVGMARMNLVNVFRGKLRRGEDVVIGEKTLKGKKVEK